MIETDSNKEILRLIDRAISHVEIFKSVFPSESLTNLYKMLLEIKGLYPINFKSFLMEQLVQYPDNIFDPLYLIFSEGDAYKLVLEKVEKIPEKAKKKWYQL